MNCTETYSTIIDTLDDLVTALSEEERTTFNDIFRSINIPPIAFDDYSSWCKECYTRNCIFENERFELILLCWEKGQYTPIHDHGGEECWVKVIKGEFRETIYKKDRDGKLELVKSEISKTGQITYMIDFMGFHRLENISDNRSMSLHLYGKPIRSCNIYDEDLKKFVGKELDYDTIAY